jgi:hypothetical protein
MTPAVFVKALSAINLPNVFNPYAHVCPVHDRADAAVVRRRNLRSYLQAAQDLGIDTVWMGRDLGYRGGRRTGLALTDEHHLHSMPHVYPGTESARTTRGPAVKERTAAEIWAVLGLLEVPPLLWNVFPYHPHEPDQPFTNRRFTARELQEVDDLNAELFEWLGIKRIISIGQDAATYALKFGVEVLCVRHPSYGGVTEFRQGMGDLYSLNIQDLRSRAVQEALF